MKEAHKFHYFFTSLLNFVTTATLPHGGGADRGFHLALPDNLIRHSESLLHHPIHRFSPIHLNRSFRPWLLEQQYIPAFLPVGIVHSLV
jgi:hypothetical protein